MIIALALLYFLPFVIACIRGHHQKLAIFMVCLLLGWSGIAWLFALIWACTAVKPDLLRPKAVLRLLPKLYMAPHAEIDFSVPPPRFVRKQ